jgi:2'-5' RNA ligase
MAKRIFIAIEIDKDLRDILHKYSSNMFLSNDNVKIIPTDNLHITLKFIGNTSEEDINVIRNIIKMSVSGHEAFDYELEDFPGAFPNKSRARIAFISIKNGGDRFRDVYDSLEDSLSGIGIGKEQRDFHPHITIARAKRPVSIEEASDRPLPSHECPLNASSVTLFESILSRQGARYINIERFGLK